jgi:hypothetical protein
MEIYLNFNNLDEQLYNAEEFYEDDEDEENENNEILDDQNTIMLDKLISLFE